MLNSGIGPVISKKINKSNGPLKKSGGPSGMSMYSAQMMNQNKMMMPGGINLAGGSMNFVRHPDPTLAMQQQQQQQPSSTMKIESISLQPAKKVSSHFMMGKGLVSSPNLSQTSNSTKDVDIRPQMPSNPIIGLPNQQPSINITRTDSSTIPSMAMDKDLSKPSEIQTSSLRIGNNRFSNNTKITTKIIFGKRQFVWEIMDLNSPTKGDSDNKGLNKRRFELKFSDIEKIEVNTENSSINIETREKPTEFKEHTTQSKKNNQWLKEATYDTESEFGEEESRSGVFAVFAVYPRDILTKSTPGKISHLEKLKKTDLPLVIDGRSTDSIPSTPMKSSSMNYGYPGDSFQGMSAPHLLPTQSYSQSLQPPSMKKDMSFPDLQLHSQNSFYKDPLIFPNDLHILKGPSERLVEESPQNDLEEDDEEKEFPLLTKDKKIEAKKFEAQLKGMKNDDKIDLIMEGIKPKKFGINVMSKKIHKCPIYRCAFQKSSVSSLKSHLKQEHRRVMDVGFNVDDNGMFIWNPDLVDFSLMVAKIYPRFVKNIVKEAKKMP